MSSVNRSESGFIPQVIMHNGMEFITAVEACKRMDISVSTLAKRVRTGFLKPYRIPGVSSNGYGKPTHYFKADEVRKFMS